MQAIEAGKSNGRIILGFILCLGFIALGLWLAGFLGTVPEGDGEGFGGAMAALFGTSEENIGKVFGWLCIILFGIFALLHIKLLFTPGPAVTLNEQGIWMARWKTAPVAWDYIDHISQISAPGQRSFGVFLTDNGREALGKRKKMGSAPDYYLNLVGTKTDFNKVYDYIHATHPLLLRQ